MSLPPYAAALGVERCAGDGPPVLLMPFADDVVGRPGFLHGGAIAGLLELAALAALEDGLAAEGGASITPVSVTVDFMRGGRDKPTFAAGIVTRLGKRMANVDATAWQDDRAQPIARARMNYLLERPASG